MTKGVLKEIMIILLLIFVIILLLGVLLYDYVPMNKVVPQDVKYVQAEDTKKVLEEKEMADSQSVVLTYEVTATDLKNYQKGNEYKAGRKNPFGPITTGEAATETGTANSSGTTGTSGETNSGSSQQNNSSGTTSSNNSGNDTQSNSTNYYPDKGVK